MKSFLQKKYIVRILLCAGMVAFSQEQAMGQSNVISRSAAQGGTIIVGWAPVSGAAGYQVYRKNDTDPNYPVTPLNATPIASLTNCTILKNLLLTPDSTNWNPLSYGLADTTGIFNPCEIASILSTSDKYTRLLFLSAFNVTIAKAAGLSFEDATAIIGNSYQYRIEAVDGSNNPIEEVATDLGIVAGQINLPGPPSGILAEAGDNIIQVSWDTGQPGAAGYRVYRSITPNGFYQQVNLTDYSLHITHTLNGDSLPSPRFGFSDFRRFDSTGAPESHDVNGAAINGPKNGVTYHYKVGSVDLLGRPGLLSTTPFSAIPLDSTAPGVPDDVSVAADETSPNGSVEIRWRHVTHDVNAHFEDPGVTAYEVYRFETSQNPDSAASTLVVTLPVTLSNDIALVVSTVDNSPGLRLQYGDKTWWYRVKAIDYTGNKSTWTAAFRATLKDITQPSIPDGVVADSYEDRIELNWNPNTDPDIHSYQVYRSLCHYGEWVPCPENEVDPPRDPDCPPKERDPKIIIDKIPVPCSGPFIYLGEISADSLLRVTDSIDAAFIDRTIPDGSPLCYAYWIKAIDGSGNISGDFPFPSATEQFHIVCERLRDKTPPEPAIISGLIARDHALRVDWIAPPTQDTRAYHVYRAPEKEANIEPDAAQFVWIGGITVEQPPLSPAQLNTPYEPLGISTCGSIPAVASEDMSAGSLLDTGTDPHVNYWYKVVGIDFDGNETDLSKAVSVSSFTFETQRQEAPTIETLLTQTEPCAIRLEWFPIFDQEDHTGFLIYKSLKSNGPFIQMGTMVTENSYVDRQVVDGQKYYYKIAIVQRDGKISEISSVGVLTP